MHEKSLTSESEKRSARIVSTKILAQDNRTRPSAIFRIAPKLPQGQKTVCGKTVESSSFRCEREMLSLNCSDWASGFPYREAHDSAPGFGHNGLRCGNISVNGGED
jgi:hypothetical protein